jgi:MarR family 2-MHQ and catechol resistance regulon transcriptional repressor
MSLGIRFIPRKDAMDKLQKSYPDFRPYYVEAVQALFQLSGDLEKAMESHFSSRCNFSRGRFLFLLVLLHAENNRLSPHDIAKTMNVTRGNMTGLIEGLIQKGYVTKSHDPVDRRVVWIEITEEGKAFLKEIFPDYFKRMSEFMSVLTKSEIDTFIGIARKLHAGLGAFTRS